MSTIYIVTSGQYSDYSIEAVFSDEEKAKNYCRYYSDRQGDGTEIEAHDIYHGYRIEPYELDPDVKAIPVGLFPYEVSMTKEGDSCCEKISYAEMESKKGGILFYGNVSQYVSWVDPVLQKERLTTFVLAKDKEHAIKIANERRIIVLARNLWPKEISSRVVPTIKTGTILDWPEE